MLLAIRDKAQGWIAWAIVIFISIPFALWGIQSYFDIGGEPVVAEVGGIEIKEGELERRTRNYKSNLRAQLGSDYNPDLLSDAVLRDQMLEQMINEIVQQLAAESWGMRAGDELVRESIRANESFQGPNGFDLNIYTNTLRSSGYSQPQFEEAVRQEMVQRQFVQGIQGSAFLTSFELREGIQLQDQMREIEYVKILAADFEAQLNPTEDELKAYYDSNAAQYRIPERVKVEFIKLDLDTVASQVEVDEQTLRDYYESHQGEFQAPEERRVRHIMMVLAENADDATTTEAQSRATKIRDRLLAGEDFAAVAAEVSEDPGSAEQGGDLGWLSAGDMPEAFEDAALALELGLISEPIRTPFGLHLIEVTESRAGGEGDFETLRADVEKAYRTTEAESRFYDMAEKLADTSYEIPDSLAPAAEALGLSIQESDWVNRSGAEGDLGNPKVINSAFSEDVLDQGNNSELIELSEDKVLVFRVVEHETEQAQPFDEVAKKVEKAFIADKSSQLAAEQGMALVEQAKQGDALASLLTDKVWSPQAPGLVGRQDITVPGEISRQAFNLVRPAEGQVSATGMTLTDGDYAVIVVNQVRDGEASDLESDAMKMLAAAQDASIGRKEYQLLTAGLRAEAEVEIQGVPGDSAQN
ncbi:MAG: SurA N-terminal domain-containing protein [bacterium]